MTGNQIAYASMMEGARHNAEVERLEDVHKTNSERLAAEANDITRQRNNDLHQYETEKNRIEEKYKQLYLELETAQGNRRLDLQEEMNKLNGEKIRLEDRHNLAMESYSRRSNELMGEKQAEDARHNKEVERITGVNNAETIRLKERQLEYEETAARMQTFYTGLRTNAEVRRTELQQDLFHLEEKKTASEINLTQEKKRDLESQRHWRPIHEIATILYYGARATGSVGGLIKGLAK